MATVESASFKDTANTDPYGFYDLVRDAGEVVWDEQVNGWLVTSHSAIRELMREDKTLVRHFGTEITDPTFLAVIGGKRSRIVFNDDRQVRHHRWFVQRINYSVVDGWRETLLRPILDQLLDGVAAEGRVEVWGDLADKFSVRVIAAFMRLPWQDDEWIARCKRMLERKQAYINVVSVLGVDERTEREALEASEQLGEMVHPYILAAKEREPLEDDPLALLWAEGQSIMPDWSVEDMHAWVVTTFFAGTETTTHSIANALYLMMTVPGLQDELRNGGSEKIERFGEEVLRLYPSVHYTPRLANKDFEFRGQQIRKDQVMLMLNASANRDPGRYGCPNEIDHAREPKRDHLTFSMGPRSCAGAALARGEIQETVAKVLERLPNLRLDPDAEPPRFEGFTLRSYRPLHALFDAP